MYSGQYISEHSLPNRVMLTPKCTQIAEHLTEIQNEIELYSKLLIAKLQDLRCQDREAEQGEDELAQIGELAGRLTDIQNQIEKSRKWLDEKPQAIARRGRTLG